MTQQCGLCGAFIRAGRTGKCKRCGCEWDNGPVYTRAMYEQDKRARERRAGS